MGEITKLRARDAAPAAPDALIDLPIGRILPGAARSG